MNDSSAQGAHAEAKAEQHAMTDLERARNLLSHDPDEMDEAWLAGIIAAIRAAQHAATWAAAEAELRNRAIWHRHNHDSNAADWAIRYANHLATHKPTEPSKSIAARAASESASGA
jgi:hypothetical protein